MRHLPLYPHAPIAAAEAAEPMSLDPSCTRCPLHEGVRTPCLPAEGEPGGLLVVDERPGKIEDQLGRPAAGDGGKLMRKVVAAHWRGPVAIDTAIRCAPGARELKDKHAEQCRGYLAQTVLEARPTRIVALGGWAAYSLLGRSVSPMSSRRGYTYLLGGRFGKEPIPVFFVMSPGLASRNRFLRRWFEEDLAWALTCPPPALPPIDEVARVVTTPREAEAAVAELSAAEWASVDVESAGLMFTESFRLLCVSATAKGEESPWVWDGPALARPALKRVLDRWLADPKAKKVGANVKFDELASEFDAWRRACAAREAARTRASAVDVVLAREAAASLGARGPGLLGGHVRPPLVVRGVVGDVRLWRKLLEPEAEGRLDAMAELVGMGGMKQEAQEEMRPTVAKIKKGLEWERRLAKRAQEDLVRRAAGDPPKKHPKMRPEAQAALDELHRIDRDDPALAKLIRDPDVEWEAWAYALVPNDMLLRYNARDTVGAARVGIRCEQVLSGEPELDRIRREVVDRASHAVKRVEGWGVCVDRPALQAFSSYLDGHLAQTRARLDAQVGADFDPESHDQVRELLFDKLRLKPLKETRTGKLSTDAEVLEALAGKHPVVGEILKWRQWSKFQGTYGRGLLPRVRDDGRIHTSILLDGARSGRTASQNPNLQNIPRAADSAEGKMVRDCFVAPPGWIFLELDYSQIELRIAAMLSRDPEMRKIFKSGVDYHRRTAELVAKIAWGIDPSQVQAPHRTQAKTINFSTLYGAGIGSIAARLGITYAQAERVVTAIMGHFKVLDGFIKSCISETRRTGYAWTWWAGQRARRRPLYGVADPDEGRRITAENGAFNTPVQGTANEFCVASMAECVEWIEEDGLEDDAHLILPVHDSMLFEVREPFALEAANRIRDLMLSHDSDGVPLEADCKIGRSWGSLVDLPLRDPARARAVADRVMGAAA